MLAAIKAVYILYRIRCKTLLIVCIKLRNVNRLQNTENQEEEEVEEEEEE